LNLVEALFKTPKEISHENQSNHSMIVIIQLMPAVFMTVGMIKGLLQSSKPGSVKAEASLKD